jgi:hypothetical protein
MIEKCPCGEPVRSFRGSGRRSMYCGRLCRDHAFYLRKTRNAVTR